LSKELASGLKIDVKVKLHFFNIEVDALMYHGFFKPRAILKGSSWEIDTKSI